MIRKTTLTAATVALVMLALALPAMAMPAAAAPEPFGWDLQLRNAKTPKYGADMTHKAFAAWAAEKDRRVTIVDGATFKGVSLKTLVGYFDDNNRQTFNATLAAQGYNVVILGMDSYAATFASAQIAQLGDKVIVADLADGAALPVPAAHLDAAGLPHWLPDWPLRVVSLDPGIIAAEMNVRGVMRLSIEPAVMPPAASPPEAFAWDLQLRNTQTPKYGADMTSKEFAAWVAQKHRRVTIVDGATYKGASLKTLVGYFDDNNRQTFNATLAAKGYSVVITGFDGFAQTWASADIARLGDKVILADLADGAALPVPAAYLDGAGLPQWIPDWPLRVVSLDPGIVSDMKVQGVGRLSIVPAVAPMGVTPF